MILSKLAPVYVGPSFISKYWYIGPSLAPSITTSLERSIASSVSSNVSSDDRIELPRCKYGK